MTRKSKLVLRAIQLSLFLVQLSCCEPKVRDPELLEKVHQFLNATTVKNVHPKTRGEELDAWEVPSSLMENYPYQLSGFDEEGRPIWISEWGKFDFRKILEDGKDSQDLFVKYIEKTARVLHKSVQIMSTPERPVTQAFFLIDFDGLKLTKITDIQTAAYALTLARLYADDILGGTNKVVIINANHIALIAVQLAKSVLGDVFQQIHVFGSDKSQWIPYLRRWLPLESLPERYGGAGDLKPLFIYG